MAELFLMAAATTVEHLLPPGVLGVLRRDRGGGDGGTRFVVEPASARCDMDAAHCAADGHYAAAPPSPACGAPPSERAMLPSLPAGCHSLSSLNSPVLGSFMRTLVSLTGKIGFLVGLVQNPNVQRNTA
jgi:hypothetical protein